MDRTFIPILKFHDGQMENFSNKTKIRRREGKEESYWILIGYFVVVGKVTNSNLNDYTRIGFTLSRVVFSHTLLYVHGEKLLKGMK